MSVYYRFEAQDILWAVINASPRIVLASGSNGWHGNTGPSGSLSLYEGTRGNPNFSPGNYAQSGLTIYPLDPVDTHSIDKTIYVSGSYPSTGSVRMVKVRNTPVTVPAQYSGQVTAYDWYQEHFNPIAGLFDYYSRFNAEYFTGSYDFYSLFFQENLRYQAPIVAFSGNMAPTISSSMTAEMQVKPVAVTSSFQDFVIQAQRGRWKFYITGSTGQLAWTDFASVVTSSFSLTAGIWQAVAVAVGAGSASFYLNGALATAAAYTGSVLASKATGSGLNDMGYITVGAEVVLSQSFSFVITGGMTASVTSSFLANDNGFDGFMFDSRIWSRNRSFLELSSSFNSTMLSTGSDQSLVHYARFNDGPYGHAHGFVSGSGAFCYAPTPFPGQLVNFNATLPVSPTWHPVDNPNFVTPKTRINDQTNFFKVIHVPAMFYGRQIATGSVNMVCNTYSNKGLRRVLMDDGKGRLYISGSALRPIGGEDYTGMRWNKVGNVFYSEGLIVITDPSLFDFGEVFNDVSPSISDTLQVSFSGLERISTRVFMCRIGPGQANASNNPTFSTYSNDPKSQGYERYNIKTPKPVTWITAIGLYNEEHKLVAVAKLASPIRKREKDKLHIRLRMDF